MSSPQAVISGIGNIYRAELLFRHRLDPLQPGCELRENQWSVLWSDLVELMHDGVRCGRIDTVRPEHDPVAMGRPPRQDRHGGEVYVYRRAGAPCLVCATDVVTARHAGRNLYWCRSSTTTALTMANPSTALSTSNPKST
ncbi:MAG: hypothetical protein ACRDTH_27345 [Pseudonocardiaceae bacterium]